MTDVEARPGCDNCAAYTNTIRTLLDDWATADCPQNPSTYSAQIGAALAMYCEHLANTSPPDPPRTARTGETRE